MLRSSGKAIACFLIVATVATGCRTSSPKITVNTQKPNISLPQAVELPPAPFTNIEPRFSQLPILDPTSVGPELLNSLTPRPLTEATCRELATAHVTTANLLEGETGVPRIQLIATRSKSKMPPNNDELMKDVRAFAATEARNRSANDALLTYYQLAEATARSELVRQSLDALDEARRLGQDAKSRGAIVELDELNRQRATTIALLGQAEVGMKLLDLDLRRRLGVDANSTEILRPSGEFGISVEPVQLDAAIAFALQNRADLQALRTVYLQLAPENLVAVREYLRALPTTSGLLGVGPQLPIARRAMLRQADCLASAIATAAGIEIEIRRQQLWLLIAERERAAADEVRATAILLTEQVRQVGLARWRAEQLQKRADDLRKDKAAYVALPAIIEASRARGDVLSAVMNWHQSRVRFLAAQGVLGLR